MNTEKLDLLQDKVGRLMGQLAEAKEAVRLETNRLAAEVSPFAVGDVVRKGKRRYRVDTIIGSRWGRGDVACDRWLCTNIRADGSLGAQSELWCYDKRRMTIVKEGVEP